MSTETMAAGAPVGERNWLSVRERGTVFGIRAAFVLANLLGRRASRPLVAVIALWYRLFDRAVVRHSRTWLERVHGRPAGFWAVYRHLRTFAQVTLDKVYLLTGRTRGLAFTRTGGELLDAQLATGKGAMLLGAHLGSYEAMRAGGQNHGIHIEILGHFENSRMINALLTKLNPRQAAQVIHVGGDPIGVVTRVQDAIQNGHLVAAMGDRVGLDTNVVHAKFFGEDAPFAGGPFLMAAILRCPVYLVFGLYREPGRYDLSCERFADVVELPRRDRAASLRTWVQRYADRLEHHCRLAPENWFNFFDFWSARGAPRPRVEARR